MTGGGGGMGWPVYVGSLLDRLVHKINLLHCHTHIDRLQVPTQNLSFPSADTCTGPELIAKGGPFLN